MWGIQCFICRDFDNLFLSLKTSPITSHGILKTSSAPVQMLMTALLYRSESPLRHTTQIIWDRNPIHVLREGHTRLSLRHIFFKNYMESFLDVCMTTMIWIAPNTTGCTLHKSALRACVICSALLGHPRCGLSIWLSLLAIFNTLFWVWVWYENGR